MVQSEGDPPSITPTSGESRWNISPLHLWPPWLYKKVTYFYAKMQKVTYFYAKVQKSIIFLHKSIKKVTYFYAKMQKSDISLRKNVDLQLQQQRCDHHVTSSYDIII